MHIVLAVLGAIAAILFYMNRISKSAGDLVDTANEIGNLPRKLRYRKKAGKRGLDLVSNPIEAATVLMISVARLDRLGRVSDAQAGAMAEELSAHMQLEPDYAEDLIIQMQSLSGHLVQPESTLFPMISLLQNNISQEDAKDLAGMMKRIASVDSPIAADQADFIRRYKDRMGLLG